MWISLEEFSIFPSLPFLPPNPPYFPSFFVNLQYIVLVSIMIPCLYMLQSNHHNKSLFTSVPIHRYRNFFLVMRTSKIYSQKLRNVQYSTSNCSYGAVQYICWSCVCLLQCLLRFSAHFKIELVFAVSCITSLHISDSNPYQIHYLQIFSPIQWIAFAILSIIQLPC